MGCCLADKSGDPVRQQIGVVRCHASGISGTSRIFWFAGKAMDALRDRLKEFHAQFGRPPCKPGRRLIRTDHAGIIEFRCLFRERAALRFVDFGKQDRPARAHYRALAGRAERPGHNIRRLAIHRSAKHRQHHVMSHFVSLECGHV